MSTQLKLYNKALTLYLGERKLASLSENREPRRVLDDVWDGGVKSCLEQGQWKFALRTSKLTYDPGIEPSFGYARAFEKPNDCVRVSKLCQDEFFNQPILAYSEESGFWFAELDEIYISYVSDHASFGNDLSLWPESFTNWVAAWFASQASIRLKQSDTDVEKLFKIQGQLKKNALSKDALQGPTQFLPQGNWTRARTGGAYRNDRGSRSRLIG